MAETSNWYNIGYRAKAGDLGINKPPHKEAWEQVQDMLMQKQKDNLISRCCVKVLQRDRLILI